MLTLKTKTARFEWVDDDVESVVTLSAEDDQETLVRKLKRIVALVEGPEPRAMANPEYGVLREPKYPALDALPPQVGNGWAATVAPPELPEDRKGEWEMIPPEEQA